MLRITGCLTVVSLLSLPASAQEKAPTDPLAPGENIYRHYTGTVGRHKAVFDLRYGFVGSSNFGGSTYYFTDEGGLNYFLVSQPPTTMHTEVFRAQVFPENVPMTGIKDVYSIFVQTPRFEFSLSHDSMIGKWFNPNGQEQLPITLTEDNTSCVPLEFGYAADSATTTSKKNEPMKVLATCKGVRLSARVKEKDAAFISKAVAQFMGGAKEGKDSRDLPLLCVQKYMTDFRAAVSSGREATASNFTGNYTLFPVYNDNGFLVLQKGGFQYDFEHREYTDRHLYLCLDVKEKKVLKLEDVITADKDALSALLEKAFRKKYQVEPAKKISDYFNSEKMPATNNFTLASKGIIISYSPSKVFKEDQDISELQEMRIFLSYDELGSMLKPEFKNRIGVK